VNKPNKPSGASTNLFTRYPLSSVFIYNGITTAHFGIGTAGIILGYQSLTGFILGLLYFVFAVGEMYVLMPLKVCPNCVYFKLENSLCVSGMNVVSRKITGEGNLKDLPNRAKGLFCSNNLYIAALVIPIIAVIPALIINFSFILLLIFLALAGLLLFRFFVIFPKIACVHCRAKNICPQAQKMGL